MYDTLIPSNIASALAHVRQRIQDAAKRAKRPPSDIQLLAVSKTFNAHAVLEAAQAGQTAFGENYIQEAIEKITTLAANTPPLQLEWHCIGPVQSNKTRLVAEHFDWLHTLDRAKIADRLHAQRPEHVNPLNVCIQVNIDHSATKSGVDPSEALALARHVLTLPRLHLRGMMCIPDPSDSPEQTRQAHRAAKTLFDTLRAKLLADAPHFDTLSMGMSADLECAIEEGSTMVRVGSALFGQRPIPAQNAVQP